MSFKKGVMVHICDLRFFLYAVDMALYQKIHCPECGNTDIMKAGFTAERKQRYRCRFTECDKSHFLLDYSYRAYLPGVKKQAVDMAINGSGIRDTARVLNISRTTILSALKKRKKSRSG